MLHLEGEGHLAQAVQEVGGEGTIVVLKLKKSLDVGLLIPRQVDLDLQRHLWTELQTGGNFHVQWESPKNT